MTSTSAPASPAEPAWLTKGRSYIGFHEQPGNRGIEEFIEGAKAGKTGDAWCALYVNNALERVGIRGTRSATARSFTRDPNFTRLETPRLGCITVLWRGSPNADTGHVGFWLSENDTVVTLLDGNDDDQVKIGEHPKDRVLGYFWPVETEAAQPTPSPPSKDAASSRFAECVRLVLADEGGNDDDPRDPGGRTSRGIQQREWDTWRKMHAGLPADVFEAPQDQIEAIYRAEYWDRLRCDDLPPGVDYCVFDYGVNSGPSRSAKELQKLLTVDQDGEIGPITAAAAARADAHTIVERMCADRLAFLRDLKAWAVFGNGWSSRIAGVRGAALKMADSEPKPAPAPSPTLKETQVPEQKPAPATTPTAQPVDLAPLVQALVPVLRDHLVPAIATAAKNPATATLFEGLFASLGKYLPHIAGTGLTGVLSAMGLGVLGATTPAGIISLAATALPIVLTLMEALNKAASARK